MKWAKQLYRKISRDAALASTGAERAMLEATWYFTICSQPANAEIVILQRMATKFLLTIVARTRKTFVDGQ